MDASSVPEITLKIARAKKCIALQLPTSGSVLRVIGIYFLRQMARHNRNAENRLDRPVQYF